MIILPGDDVDISGFASIRERVMLRDQALFGISADHCFCRYADCVYLANAWFLPGGETGLHHHEGMDIVSLVPRGSMYHDGSLGKGVTVEADHVQLQRDGGKGFRHNECNPNDFPQPLIQLWIKPSEHAPEPQYKVIDARSSSHKSTCVYGGELFNARTRIDVVHLSPADIAEYAEAMIFVVRGSAHASSESQALVARQGDLLQGENLCINVSEPTALLVVRATTAG